MITEEQESLDRVKVAVNKSMKHIDKIREFVLTNPQQNFWKWLKLPKVGDFRIKGSIILKQVPSDAKQYMKVGLHGSEHKWMVRACRWWVCGKECCPKATDRQLCDFAIHKANVHWDMDQKRQTANEVVSTESGE